MKRLFIITVMLLWVAIAFGQQLTGTKNIPGDYATLSIAIADLNTHGVGPGGVTLNLLAGNPETSPAGGYSITASGNPTDSIVISGNGNTITAPTPQANGALNDAIFKIIGGDYITIQGFIMNENAANTTTDAATNNMTEFGVALFYASATDGPQNITIQGNAINLGATYQNAFGIYANSRHTATAMITLADITSTYGAFHNLKVLNNTISSVNLGVVLVGSSTGDYMATNVEVGGNTITYGLTGTFSSYVSVSNSVNGILMNSVLNVNVHNNTLTCNGTNTAGTLCGIYHYANGTLPTTGSINNFFNNNIITLTNGTTSTMYGIYLNNYNSIVTNNVIGNTINHLDASVATIASVYGIYHVGAAKNQYIRLNVFNLNPTTTTGTVFVINSSNTIPANGTQVIDSNHVTLLNKTGAGGSVYFYYSNGGSPSTVTKLINNNLIENVTLTGATSFIGIYDYDGLLAGGPVKTIANNTFKNSTGGTLAITGININNGTHQIYNNLFQNISNGANITAISAGGSATTAQNVNNNIIKDLSTTSGSITGILSAASGTNAVSNVYSNIIYNLTASAATSTVSGISVSNGTTINLYNNAISELYTPIATGTTNPQIAGMAILGGTTVNAYYNTIYLNATSSGANFITTGLYASTNPNLKLINNIIVNISTPTGTGLTSVFRISSTTLTSYNNESGNNLFYAGTPSATNAIFYDGTTIYQTIADFQTLVAPRDEQSVTEMPPFVNVSSHPYDLHIQTTVPTFAESGGKIISGIDNDFDGDIRFGSTGYTGTGIAPDLGADEFEGTPNFTCTTPAPGNTIASNASVCLGETITLSLQNAVSGTGNSYQWKKSTDGVTYNDIPGATNSFVNVIIITAPMHFECEVTCVNGPVTVTSTPVLVDFANKILTTTDAAVCGTGQASLEATASNGSTINWYNAATAGNIVGTGSPFVTPLISSTTTYYVAAETTIPASAIIGAGASTSTSYESPFYHLYGGQKSQYLIHASELQAAGLSAGPITSLAFEVVVAGITYQDFNFSIGTTPANLLTTTFVTGLQGVYSNAAYSPITGVNTITFNTPLNWDGTSNIVVEFCWSNNNTGGTSATVKYDNTTYISQSYYRADSQPASTLCATTTATSTQSKRPKFTFSGTTLCSSPRVAVTATVTASTPVSITNDTTACNNSIVPIQVITGTSDYNQFTWSPVTDLYTDAAATISYVGGASATQVYLKTTQSGQISYVCNAYNTTSFCGASDTVNIFVLPASITITASPESICQSGTAVLSVSPNTGFGTATFQWAQSSDGNTYSDITGETGFDYTTPTLISSMYYQWTAMVGTNVCILNNTIITVTNPTFYSTTPGSRCGEGTVNLAVVPQSNNNTYWYAQQTDVIPLAQGNTFTTPSINMTTSYWAEPVFESTPFTVGVTSDVPTAFTSFGNYAMYFASINDAIIHSIDIYPSTAGTLNILLINNLGATINTRSFTIAAGDISTTVKKTLVLDFIIPSGVTGWKLAYDLAIYRGSGTYVYGQAVNGFAITGNSVNGDSITSGTRYYLYNWQVKSLCKGTKVQIAATVNTPPAISVIVDYNNVCAGQTINLIATSSNSGYQYTWTPTTVPVTGANVAATPTVSTDYSVLATDSSGGPSDGCATSANVMVNVYPLPVATASVNNPSITCGGSVQLTAGELYTPAILTDNFNGATNTFTTVNTSTGGTPAAAAWTLRPDGYTYSTVVFHSNDNSQFYFSNSDAQGSGGTTHTELISSTFSSVGIDSVVIDVYQYYRHYTGGSAAIEIFDGTQWNTLQTYTATIGTATNFNHTVISLPSTYLNNANLKIRFVYDASWGYYLAIDNPTVKLYNANTFAWTSTPVGFTSSVYNPSDSPIATTNYNVTVTSIHNCTNTGSVAVTVNNLPAPTVTVHDSCGHSALIASSYTGTLTWSTTESSDTIIVNTNNAVNVYYTNGACVSDITTATPAPVEIPTAPVVTDINACFGETVDAFTATSNYSDFIWYSDASLTTQVGTGSPFQSPETAAGTYTYYVVAINGACASDATVATLTIHDLPTVTITQNVDTLYSSVPTGNQWYSSMGAISGSVYDTLDVTITDTYYVVVTDVYGCSSVSNSIPVIIDVIANHAFAANIAITPNPAHDYATVTLGSISNATVQLISADGKVIYNTKTQSNKQVISLKGLASGIYTVKIITANKTVQKKLMVE